MALDYAPKNVKWRLQMSIDVVFEVMHRGTSTLKDLEVDPGKQLTLGTVLIKAVDGSKCLPFYSEMSLDMPRYLVSSNLQ